LGGEDFAEGETAHDFVDFYGGYVASCV
jgi:hypothetical protein